MKYIINIACAIMLFVGSSCDNWLEVEPELDIYETTLFESKQGYYIALNGLYVDIASTDLYGKEMVWGAMEAWGYSYNLEPNENTYPAYVQLMKAEYEKEDVKALAERIWQKAFRVIAEANNLLQNIKDDSDLFVGAEYARDMIIGEALAVRAMMHFDLVRIFAQAPVVDGGTSKTIPWVDKYPSEVNPPVETKEVLQKIMADLDSAKVLLKPIDASSSGIGYRTSFTGKQVERRLCLLNSQRGSVDDEVFYFRCNRLNYYAVCQLAARVALWAGDMESARTNSYVVVSAVESLSPLVFTDSARIGNPATLANVETRLQSEIIFGAYNKNLKDWTEIYYGASASVTLPIEDKSGIFAACPTDARAKAIPNFVHTKYTLTGLNMEQITAPQYIMPVLRVPESYFIYAESSFDVAKSDAIYIFNKFIEARNNSLLLLSEDISKEEFIDKLVSEYRREFLSEGLIVFVYKRLNLPLRSSIGDIPNNGRLVLPVPDSEAGI